MQALLHDVPCKLASMTPGQLLQALLDRAKTNPTALAKAIDMGNKGLQPGMSRLLKGGNVRPNTLDPVAEHFGMDASAFTTDAAATEWASRLGLTDDVEEAGDARAPRRVPVVGTAKMGDDGFYEEMSGLPGAGDGHIEIATRDPNAYGLRVRGQSMFPAIRDGWYVLVEPNGTPHEGEYVLIRLKDGRKMVKEFLFRRQGSIEVMSVNGEERFTIHSEDMLDMQAVGAVVSPSKWQPD